MTSKDVDNISFMLGKIVSDVAEIKESQKETEERLRQLELRAATAGGVAGLVVSTFASVMAWNLKNFTGGS